MGNSNRKINKNRNKKRKLYETKVVHNTVHFEDEPEFIEEFGMCHAASVYMPPQFEPINFHSNQVIFNFEPPLPIGNFPTPRVKPITIFEINEFNQRYQSFNKPYYL